MRDSWRGVARAAVAIMLAAALTGCTGAPAGRTPMTGQSTRVIESGTTEQVLAAASTVLRSEFARVRPGTAPSSLVTEPLEFDTSRESGSARDLYRGRSTMRRIATFSASQQGGRTVAQIGRAHV